MSDERGEIHRCENCGLLRAMQPGALPGERWCRDCCDEDAMEREIEAGRMVVDWDGQIISWDGEIIE